MFASEPCRPIWWPNLGIRERSRATKGWGLLSRRVEKFGTATPIASDGFEQEFGVFGTLPGPAVKQGWMCCLSGQRHLHSVGVVDSRVVVLLSEVPSSVGWDTAKAALDAAAAAVPPPVGP